jgi:hypothetical protein
MSRVQVLPLEQLSWENFERLCYRLASRTAEVVDCRRYGTQGQAQGGIDIYLRTSPNHGYVTWQCKKYRKFGSTDIRSAVTKFLKSDWATRSSIFHLAVTTDLSDSQLVIVIEEEAARCKKRKIDFIPLDRSALSARLKEHPDIVDDFFERPWVEAFCGHQAALSLNTRKLTKEHRLKARRALRDLYVSHFNFVDVGLPIAARGMREAIPNLPLQERYVAPSVDALTTVIEPKESNFIPSGPAKKPGSKPDGHQASGPRVRQYRRRQGFFEWLAATHQGLILGGPGLGKSAALRFVILDLLSDEPTQLELAKKWGGQSPLANAAVLYQYPT